jgi:L(+)-tartrate dehydratase alpha subunit
MRLNPSLIEAIKKATVRAPLRHNAVEVFDEYNTGSNIGHKVPWIDWELVQDSDELELFFYMAGGGCSLPGMAKVLMPLEGYDGIARAVFDQMTTYGVNACPPGLVGIGIAGSAEVAAKLSKKALLRPVGSHNPNLKAAQMEKDIEEGPQFNRPGDRADSVAGCPLWASTLNRRRATLRLSQSE